MSTSSDDNNEVDKNTRVEKRIEHGATTMKQILCAKAKGEKILECFDIGGERKKFVLMSAGKLLRWFRSYIKTHFLYNEDRDVNENPPAKYASFLTDDVWREFIFQRTNNDFMEISARNKMFASNLEYPYRSSRTTYTYIEQQLADPSASPPSRHIVWKQTRVNKKGELPDDTSRELAGEFVRLSQNPEEAQDDEKLDFLAKALKKHEYPGRVRGLGFGVSQKDYQYIKKNKKKDQMQEMMAVLQAQVNRMEAEMNAQREAVAQNPPPMLMSMGNSQCVLYLATPILRVVAKDPH